MVLIKEPPCTERYARWCERTDREIIPIFLLDSAYFTVFFFIVLINFEIHLNTHGFIKPNLISDASV